MTMKFGKEVHTKNGITSSLDTWSISGDYKTLQSPSGIQVPLEAEAHFVFECEDVVVVCLDIERANNVVAYESDGTLRWRFCKEPLPNLRYWYFGGECIENQLVRLYTFDSEHDVDVKTGELLDARQAK